MPVETQLVPWNFKAPVNFYSDVRFWAANGPVMQIPYLFTAMTGTSVSSGSLIPAGSIVIGVTVRVMTAIQGASGFRVGTATHVDRWASNVANAVDSTNSIQNFAESYVPYAQGSTSVVLTANTNPFTAGSVKVLAYYIYLAPPEP